MSRDIESLQITLRVFAEARDWSQLGNPMTLAVSLFINATEVPEHFQVPVDEQSHRLDGERKEQVARESTDMALCLLQLAETLPIDPLAAVHEKLTINTERYPGEQFRGTSIKYARFQAAGSIEASQA